MIKIKRLECPDLLMLGLTPASKGQVETQKNIELFKKSTGKPAKLNAALYKVYSDKTIRKLLVEMFHGKCAYCESKIIAIYSGDIEHFRPKGGGYYWLAADWENLLFACPFCNQTHTHVISGKGKIIEVVQGKLDQFPLVSETYRLNISHGSLFYLDKQAYKKAFDLEESQRLLLNPCIDGNIDHFFKYNDQGLILADEKLRDNDQKRAETSIKVYALQRLGLVLAREAKAIQIRAQIKRVENAIINLNTYFNKSEAERIWFEHNLREEMNILHQFQDPDQEYAGMARYIIHEYFKNFNLFTATSSSGSA